MAKEKQKINNFEEELELLQKEFSVQNNQEEFFINSGSLTLDLALDKLGRGWKCGRIAELISWEGSGKTTICLETVHQAELLGHKYAYIDAEHALNRNYVENAIGINWENFKKSLFQPDNGEQAFEYAKRLIKTDEVRLIVFDSTSGMLPQKIMEGEAGDQNLGLHARLFSSQIPKLNQLAAKHNTLLLFISQKREKIGVMFGDPSTTQAGHALKFFDSYRIELKRKVENENGKDEDATGITTSFHTLKNKCYEPYIKGSFYIKKGQGIDTISEIVDLASEYNIFYKHGQTIKLNKDTPEEQKYGLDEFYNMLNDNEEFYQDLKKQIINKKSLL